MLLAIIRLGRPTVCWTRDKVTFQLDLAIAIEQLIQPASQIQFGYTNALNIQGHSGNPER
jgi:hypothetical protein